MVLTVFWEVTIIVAKKLSLLWLSSIWHILDESTEVSSMFRRKPYQQQLFSTYAPLDLVNMGVFQLYMFLSNTSRSFICVNFQNLFESYIQKVKISVVYFFYLALRIHLCSVWKKWQALKQHLPSPKESVLVCERELRAILIKGSKVHPNSKNLPVIQDSLLGNVIFPVICN